MHQTTLMMSSKKEIVKELKRAYKKELLHQKRVNELIVKRRKMAHQFIEYNTHERIAYIEKHFLQQHQSPTLVTTTVKERATTRNIRGKQRKLDISMKKRWRLQEHDECDNNVLVNSLNADTIILICSHLSYLDMINLFHTSKALNLIVSFDNVKPYFDYITFRIKSNGGSILPCLHSCLKEIGSFNNFPLRENNIVHLLLVCHLLVTFDKDFHVLRFDDAIRRTSQYNALKLRDLFMIDLHKDTLTVPIMIDKVPVSMVKKKKKKGVDSQNDSDMVVIEAAPPLLQPEQSSIVTFLSSTNFSRLTVMKEYVQVKIHERFMDNYISFLYLDSSPCDVRRLQSTFLDYANKEDMKSLDFKLAKSDDHLSHLIVSHSKTVHTFLDFVSRSTGQIHVIISKQPRGKKPKEGLYDHFHLLRHVYYMTLRLREGYYDGRFYDADMSLFVKRDILYNLKQLFSF
jgi:hypothetical protein